MDKKLAQMIYSIAFNGVVEWREGECHYMCDGCLLFEECDKQNCEVENLIKNVEKCLTN